MPTYRSITVSLVSQFDLFTIPEYPPPQTPKNSLLPTPTLLSSNEAIVSVYIPTYPSSQFWISYSVSPPYPPNALYYFKLFLNGFCAVSWGCGKNDGYKGKTMFALYRSSEARMGLPSSEKRVLCFGSDSGSPKSGFGHFMELKVYRSKGRKKTPPIVEPFRNASNRNGKDGLIQTDVIGINLANAGILDDEYPRKFYKYALIDPLDQPFATFRYFYCDWAQLEAIGVISPAPSTLSSIHSHQSLSNPTPKSLPTASFLDLPVNSAPCPLNNDSLSPLSNLLSYTSHSPPPDGKFEPQAPSSTKDIRNIYRTTIATRSRPLFSAMKGRNTSRSPSTPVSFSFASLVRRSPSPVKINSSSRFLSQSPARFPRSASLGVLKEVVNSAVRRRSRAETENENAAETQIELAIEIRSQRRDGLNEIEPSVKRSASLDSYQTGEKETRGSNKEMERGKGHSTGNAKQGALWLAL